MMLVVIWCRKKGRSVRRRAEALGLPVVLFVATYFGLEGAGHLAGNNFSLILSEAIFAFCLLLLAISPRKSVQVEAPAKGTRIDIP